MPDNFNSTTEELYQNTKTLYENWSSYSVEFNTANWTAYRNYISGKILKLIGKSPNCINILDIGGGASLSLPYLVKLDDPLVKYVVVDQYINPNLLSEGCSLAIKASAMDISEYLHVIKSSDVIIMLGILMYLPSKDQQALIEEIISSACAGTLFIVHEPTHDSRPLIKEKICSSSLISHELFMKNKSVSTICKRKVTGKISFKLGKLIQGILPWKYQIVILSFLQNLERMLGMGLDEFGIYRKL